MKQHAAVNPFNAPHGVDAQFESACVTKEVLQEIRNGDASMAGDLVALAPRSCRAFRSGASATDTLDGTAVASTLSNTAAPSAKRGGRAGYAVDAYETLSTSEFVRQKREVGLVRMSLTTKKAEIRRLEERIDRAESRLRQQQEQLTNTREKFDNFLKFSNLEQDAAVRRADNEARAKLAKTVEIKKLSALISHGEAEARKMQLQIENCLSYKEFLESLSKPQWFYDVLIDLRIQDMTEKILLDAEEVYQVQSAALTAKEAARAEAALQAALEAEREKASGSKWRRSSVAAATQWKAGQRVSITAPVKGDEPEVVPLERQLEELYSSIEEKARVDIAAASATIRAEVSAMTLAAVKEELHTGYDEKRLPLCFATVDDLLEVFINVEEGNLFLIQNCHELEEELEGVTMGFAMEREEMNAMVEQRTAQLEALTNSVAEAQKKLQALDERLEALEPHGKQQRNTTEGPNTKAPKRVTAGASATGSVWDVGDGNLVVNMSPEELKKKVEGSIVYIFNLLRAGDHQVKLTANNPNTRKTTEGGEASVSGGLGRSHRSSKEKEQGPSLLSTGASGTKKTSTVSSLTGPQSPPGAPPKPKSKAAGAKIAGNAANQLQQQQDVSMGPVEMLTIIENKLEEYHRYLSDPENHVELSLMQAVMKQSDKQRRYQARIVHLANQEKEQEERIRRALERSQAPIIHKAGKPVRPRSFFTKPLDEKSARKGDRAVAAVNGSNGTIDWDEDGAEFFM
ncbi:hypothetical protein JKF63_02561 [Porcisia hertigi]|uniref:DUF4200 domain-containing protein n=1 Tax=Porcisia hertigi TaxID=2761500 RepID=A0A836I475_9TRYP|nr:hypothetical protein JKF63_02561 [Porcisia hertigi]